MKPDSNNAKPPRKVFDVTRPGKTPASATSRPVISSRQAVKDQDFSADPDKSSLLNPKQKITIQPKEDTGKNGKSEDAPLSAPQPQAAPAKPDTQPAPADSTSQAPGAPPLLTEDPRPARQPSRKDEAPNIGSAALDGVQGEDAVQTAENSAPPAENTPQMPAKKEAEAAAPEETPASAKSEPAHMHIPQEFAPENIVVSHHRKHQNLWPETLAMLAILLLLAAILNVLLDAGIIKTNLIPHIDFFRQ